MNRTGYVGFRTTKQLRREHDSLPEPECDPRPKGRPKGYNSDFPATAKQLAVLRAIEALGRGATQRGVAARLKLKVCAVEARVKAMRNRGWVEATGRLALTESGRAALRPAGGNG